MLETANDNDAAWARLPELIGVRGYARWDVEMLVRFAGSRKAGARIIERIEEQLAKNYIGHLPAKLPTDSTCQVLLYRKDDPRFGFLLALVQQLATEDMNDSTNPSVYQLQSTLDAMSMVLQAATNRRDAS
ncbi:hypothetical protein [Streptomyces sp. G1]|uniref:hypothetical protein n=1 Tax=Streptomyces sp. G1 TaxID=361572 RepID=UPI00202EF0D4|nr:hypothetical protein [Streptomyces sp. G1]MCM1973182.1 hypothetical protein [Streptomyces sp. G1]